VFLARLAPGAARKAEPASSPTHDLAFRRAHVTSRARTQTDGKKKQRDQNAGGHPTTAVSPAQSASRGPGAGASGGKPGPPAPPPADPRDAAAARRAAAARWVARAAGLPEPPPHGTDAAFRAALRDGVLLCRCANAVWGGDCVPGVVERADGGSCGLTRQRLENVTSFLDALSGGGLASSSPASSSLPAAANANAPALPPDAAFSVADLEYEGPDDRPRVVDCVLWMRAQHQQMQQQQQQPPLSPAAAEAAAAAAAAATPTPGHRSVQAAAGVTRLMQQCTAMLRERMFLDAGAAGGGGGAGGSSPAVGGGGGGGGPSPQAHNDQTPLRTGASRLSTTPRGSHQQQQQQWEQHQQQHHHRRHASVTPSPPPAHHHNTAGGRPPIGSAVAARYGGSSTGAGVLAAAHAAARAAAGGASCSPAPSFGGTPPPDQAIEAMGPILEGVLSSLTQEYERRLLSKDHELAAARDAVAALQRRAAASAGEAEGARREAEDARARQGAAAARSAEAEADPSAAEDAARLRDEAAELRAALEGREAQLRDLERRAGASAAAVREREAELERELGELREQVGAAAALREKYARAVSENRRLYHAVQDLKGSIRVFCRVRPPGATGDGGPAVLEPGAEDGELALWDVSAAARAGVGGGGGGSGGGAGVVGGASSAAALALAAGAAQRKVFRLDRVFGPDSSQADVYEDTAPLVRCVLDGYNVCIFAYGQTGSGKTHTMSGGGPLFGGGGGGGELSSSPGRHPPPPQQEEDDWRGINYRALDDLFALQESRRGEIEYRITVQMLEIYNETLRDLLAGEREGGGGQAGGAGGGGGAGGRGNGNANEGGGGAAPKLEILSTLASGCNVPGATQVEVCASRDVAGLMSRGSRARATGGTRMNSRSSRSHQVVTVVVQGAELATGATSHGCLHLVDLAGSERVGRSEASGDRLVEAQHINRSLSALGDVMAALAARGAGGGGAGHKAGAGGGGAGGGAGSGGGHVPFRNSKLTHLLQDSLSGNAKVMMFVHVSPEASSSGESLSTLKFAARVGEIALGPARRNGESGRVFEAKEAALAARRGEERREREAAALRAALEAEAARVDELSAENARLKAALAGQQQHQHQQQCQQQQQMQRGGPSPVGPSSRRLSGGGGGGDYGALPLPAAASGVPRVPRLSLGAAAASAGGDGAWSTPLRSARLGGAGAQQQPSGIPSLAFGGGGAGDGGGGGYSAGGGGGGGQRQATPPRSAGGSVGGARALSPGLSLTPPAPYFGGGGADAPPGSGGPGGVVREASSSQRHIERLAAARAGGGGARGGIGGGGHDGALTARGGRPSGDGSLTARGGGDNRMPPVVYPAYSRAPDAPMPMTARPHRASGGVGSGGGFSAACAPRAPAASFAGAPRALAAAGGGFSAAPAPAPAPFPSGSHTARGALTARGGGGGGRWK